MITPEERADLTREITEHILLLLPGVISHLINNIVAMKGLSENFYEKNKDLAAHKELVSKVIEQFEGKYPGKSAQDILDLAAVEVRKQLSLQTRLISAPDKSLTELTGVLGKL